MPRLTPAMMARDLMIPNNTSMRGTGTLPALSAKRSKRLSGMTPYCIAFDDTAEGVAGRGVGGGDVRPRACVSVTGWPACAAERVHPLKSPRYGAFRRCGDY